MAKIITVFGATGGQGGGVVSALLKAISRGEPYAIRAVTRRPDGEKAKQLKIQGCEVVVCDMDNKGSVEQAIKGSYRVFLVTNYWEHFSMEKEVEQGKRVIDVCEALGVKHLIYSGLENVKKAIGIECAHFDGKGMVEEYLHTKKLKERLPFTIVRFPFYYNNLVSLFTPRKKDDGTLLYDIPMEGVAMDGIDVTQGGECVYGILESPDCYHFKTIGLSGDKITIQQYCETLTKHLEEKGLKFEDAKITLDEYRAQPDNPAAIELGNMFEFYKRGNPDRDIRLTKKLNEETQRFDVWVRENKAMLGEAFSKKQ